MNFLQKINWVFLILLLSISSIGVTLLYSIAGGSWDPWALNQIIRILISLAVIISISLVNISFWYKLANPLYLFGIFLICYTFVLGKEVSGATRWIDLYFFSFQPAEIVKIFVILSLAKYFHSIKFQSYDIKQRIFFPFLIFFIPFLLIFKQPDLGTALIIFFTGIIVLFLSGVQMKTFFLSGVVGLISLPLFWTFLKDYQKSRIINFFDQQSNILGANYHITQSKIALGSGGFFGKGYLEGTQSRLNFIPEMETDFIFSVLGEEFGFLGILFLFFLYFILIFWAIKMSIESKNYFSKIFGVSFVTSFFLVIFINVGMVSGIVPVVGVPLPLCSYGGSAFLANFIGFGIILSGYNYRDLKLHNI